MTLSELVTMFKSMFMFNSEMTNLKQVSDFLIVLYKLFGFDDNMSITIRDTVRRKEARFDGFKRFIEVYRNPEMATNDHIHEANDEDKVIIEDFDFICDILLGTSTPINIVSSFLDFPQESYISRDVKDKLLYSYKEYGIPINFTTKKRIRVNTKKFAEML